MDPEHLLQCVALDLTAKSTERTYPNVWAKDKAHGAILQLLPLLNRAALASVTSQASKALCLKALLEDRELKILIHDPARPVAVGQELKKLSFGTQYYIDSEGELKKLPDDVFFAKTREPSEADASAVQAFQVLLTRMKQSFFLG